ncbi:MAG: IS1096 element passenger TnpR family protein [Acidimicrobiales bacterium]
MACSRRSTLRSSPSICVAASPSPRHGRLLMGRVDRWPPACARMVERMPTPPGQPVVDCTIELREVEPRVGRRLLVPASVRLDKLHRMFQAAMGWPVRSSSIRPRTGQRSPPGRSLILAQPFTLPDPLSR